MEATLTVKALQKAIQNALLEDMDTQESVLVIDNGSGLLKAGFNGHAEPFAVFATLVADVGRDLPLAVGDRAAPLQQAKYPILRGVVEDWDAMEKVWSHVFVNELRVNPSEYPVVVTESPLAPKGSRERLTRLMLKTLKVAAVYVSVGQVLALLSTARTTGLVVDSGFESTMIVPVIEGHIVMPAVRCWYMGGRHLTQHMRLLLFDRYPGFAPDELTETQVARRVKEDMCYVALDPAKEGAKKERELDRPFSVPGSDESTLVLSRERYICPELLFDPSLVKEIALAQRLQEVVRESLLAVQRSKPTLESLTSNIVLSGGNSQFAGMDARLELELRKLLPDLAIKVHAPQNRRYGAWIGGSLLASFPEFRDSCVQELAPKPAHLASKVASSTTTAALPEEEDRLAKLRARPLPPPPKKSCVVQ